MLRRRRYVARRGCVCHPFGGQDRAIRVIMRFARPPMRGFSPLEGVHRIEERRHGPRQRPAEQGGPWSGCAMWSGVFAEAIHPGAARRALTLCRRPTVFHRDGLGLSDLTFLATFHTIAFHGGSSEHRFKRGGCACGHATREAHPPSIQNRWSLASSISISTDSVTMYSVYVYVRIISLIDGLKQQASFPHSMPYFESPWRPLIAGFLTRTMPRHIVAAQFPEAHARWPLWACSLPSRFVL